MKKIILYLVWMALPILIGAQQISPEYERLMRAERAKSLQAQLLNYDTTQLSATGVWVYRDICMELARLTQDTQYLKRVLKLDAKDERANYQMANHYRELNPQRGVYYLQRVLRVDSAHMAAHQLLSHLYLKLDKGSAYFHQLKREIKYSNSSQRFYPVQKLAEIYLARKQVDSAFQFYKEMLPDLGEPTIDRAYLALAELNLKHYQDYTAVIDNCNLVLKDYRWITQQVKTAMYLRGIAYWKLKETSRAVESWSAVEEMKHDPRNEEIDLFYQQLLLENPHHGGYYYVNAIRLFVKCSFDPSKADTYLQQAITYFEKAKELGIGHFRLYYYMGRCRQRQKKYRAAIRALDQCLALAPNFADGYQIRGEVKRSLKMPAASLADFKKACALKRGEVISKD